MPKLARRLSYAETPLQREQVSQLAEILASCSSEPGDMVFRVMYSDEFITQAAQVLACSQIQALREFQAEQ